MSDSFKESAIKYHTHPLPGKLEIRPTKPLANKRDLSLAYSPGVAHACELIQENPTDVAKVTSRGNLVGVITNGTAVLGLGNIGALASKPNRMPRVIPTPIIRFDIRAWIWGYSSARFSPIVCLICCSKCYKSSGI